MKPGKLNIFFALIFVFAVLYLLLISRVPILDFLYVVLVGSVWMMSASLGTLNPILIRLTYCFLVFFSIAPFLISTLGVAVAGMFGSKLNEGGPSSCIIFGYDFGSVLYGMLVLGWLMVITIPAGLLLIVVFSLSLFAAKKWSSQRLSEKC